MNNHRRQVLHWSAKMAQLWQDIQISRAYKLKRAGVKSYSLSPIHMRRRAEELKK